MLVLSICSLKGGVGKTTVVLGLASAAQARGLSTLVIDLDPQGDATMGLNAIWNHEYNAATMLEKANYKAFTDAVQSSGWNERPEDARVDVIGGAPRTSIHDHPQPSLRRVRRIDQWLSQVTDYDLVLIDCPPSLNGLTQTAWVASDRAVIVAEPCLFAVSAADRALNSIEEIRRGPATRLKPLGILINRERQRSVEHEYRVNELTDIFGPLILQPKIPERAGLQQAQGAAKPLHRWPGQVAKEMSEMFDAILAQAFTSATTL
ncbi:ParA family protein [Micrococcales bacterium 31B]|nr:ParA family protein [Micrococcales bacterium 31B]